MSRYPSIFIRVIVAPNLFQLAMFGTPGRMSTLAGASSTAEQTKKSTADSKSAVPLGTRAA